MEFIVSRNALLQALNHCRNAINAKKTYDMFKNFTFSFPDEPDPKTMTVHTSDGNQWLSDTIAIESVPASVDAPGAFRPFAVYYHDMLRAINALDEQPLTVRVHEYQLSVHHSFGSFCMPLENVAQEFLSASKPQPDADAEDSSRLEYEVPGLRSILSRCKYAMAQDELRPVMNGVYVNLTSDFSDYVSSDGCRLVRVRKDPMFVSADESEAVSFIIPSAVVRTLLRILPKTGDVEIVYQKELLGEEMHKDRSGNPEKYTVVKRKAAASGIREEYAGYYGRGWLLAPHIETLRDWIIDNTDFAKEL